MDEEVAVGVLDRRVAAGTRADDAGRLVGVRVGRRQSGLLPGLVGGPAREPGVALAILDFAALDVLGRLEAFDLARDMDVEVLERKVLDPADTARSGLERRLEFLDVQADGSHRPEPGYDHTTSGADLRHAAHLYAAGPARPADPTFQMAPVGASIDSELRLS